MLFYIQNNIVCIATYVWPLATYFNCFEIVSTVGLSSLVNQAHLRHVSV